MSVEPKRWMKATAPTRASEPDPGLCARRQDPTARRNRHVVAVVRTAPAQSRAQGFRIPGNGGTLAPHRSAPTTCCRDRRGIGRARSQGAPGRSDRARSGSGGAADTASVRPRWPGARSPSLSPVPRIAALVIRVGRTVCGVPLWLCRAAENGPPSPAPSIDRRLA